MAASTPRRPTSAPTWWAKSRPESPKTIPEILRLAGYHTFNEGKLHYNFVYDIDQLYDHHQGRMGFRDAPEGRYWNSRSDERPFFGQIQLAGGKARAKKVVDRAVVQVPTTLLAQQHLEIRFISSTSTVKCG